MEWNLYMYIGVYVLLLSLAAFLLMGIDKGRARRGRRRIPERILLGVALLGGSPGGVLGMHMFRHKTRHWYFRYGLPGILMLQAALVAAYACWGLFFRGA
ncbi:MAG: hypothetical protein H6Q61_215 [Firmicutes bacterium]|nr:hypothetical protein [Bacillota bacterium]